MIFQKKKQGPMSRKLRMKDKKLNQFGTVVCKVSSFVGSPEAEFKEFYSRLKFKQRLHLKLYSLFQDLSRHSIETGFWWI